MVTVFAYAFPHRKTRDGLLALVASGIQVDLVIGAPRKDLNLRKPFLNHSNQSSALPVTADICDDLGINYVTADHNSQEVQTLLGVSAPKIGLILGARILSQATIEKFTLGILNLHPGVLPDNAGLYNIEWAINKGVPQGVSAHLINAEIDSGQLLERRLVRSLETSRRIRDLRQTLVDMELSMATVLLRRLISFERVRRYSLLGETQYHPELGGLAEIRAAVGYVRYRQRYESIVEKYLSKQPESLDPFTLLI